MNDNSKSNTAKKVAIILVILLLIAIAALAIRIVYLKKHGKGTAVVPDNLISVGTSSSEPDSTPDTSEGDIAESSNEIAEVPNEETSKNNTEESKTEPTNPDVTLDVSNPDLDNKPVKPTANVISLFKGQNIDNEPFKVTNMLPGDSYEKYYCVKISHNKDLKLCFKTEINFESNDLSEILDIKVTHLNTSNIIYEGKLGDMLSDGYFEDIPLPDDYETEAYYKIEVSMPTSAGNKYQNSSIDADFVWLLTDENGLLPPQTGDSTVIYIAICGASVLVVLLLLFVLRKKREEDDDSE